jgi:hypothetical protein
MALSIVEIVDHGHGAKLPENPANIMLSGQKGMLIYGSAPRSALLSRMVYVQSTPKGE